jgi:hypothetical protein
MRRKRNRKRIVEITYCIQFSKYEPSYMFCLATNPDIDAAIEMEGVITHPENLKGRELRMFS